MASSTPVANDCLRPAKKERQRISQVTFFDVSESYPPDKDVSVSYTLNGSWNPSTSDWVGLFREGTGDPNPSNYVAYEYSRTPITRLESRSVTLSVTFQVRYLPQDANNDEFRFCYVTSKGNIRGKSRTFTFVKTQESNSDCDSVDSDIVIVERGFGDLNKLQDELDDARRDNFSLRKRLEESEDETKNLAGLLASAESQIELLCNAVRKQEEENQKSEDGKLEYEAKLQAEINNLNKKLLESVAAKDILAHQLKVLQENAPVMEEAINRRLHEVETERDCLQAELAHLQEVTATSRFREAELRKAIDAGQVTTQALIRENSAMRGHEEALILAEEQIEKLTKDLNLSEQIRHELEMQLQFRSSTRSRSSYGDQYMDSSIEERLDLHRRPSAERSQEMEHENHNDTDNSSSSINIKPSSSESRKEPKKFFPNPFEKLVKAVLK